MRSVVCLNPFGDQELRVPNFLHLLGQKVEQLGDYLYFGIEVFKRLFESQVVEVFVLQGVLSCESFLWGVLHYVVDEVN